MGEQLARMGLYAAHTLGDGNCLFRALSDQTYGSPEQHARVRADVCNYLALHEARYKAFVDTDEEESWETRLQEMRKQGQSFFVWGWGAHTPGFQRVLTSSFELCLLLLSRYIRRSS